MAKALTVQSLEKLKPDPIKRREIPDGLMTGLYFMIQPSGKRSWSVRYRVHGKVTKYTIGGYPAYELGEAREQARAILRRVAKGEDPQAEKQIAKKQITSEDGDPARFDNLCRLYLAREAKPKNRSWKETARLLGLIPDPAQPERTDDPRSFIVRRDSPISRWGHKPVDAITRAEIRAYLDQLRLPEDEGGRAMGAGVNRILSAVSVVMTWAVEKEFLQANTCDAIKPPVSENHRERTLDRDDEIRAVWRAAEGMGGSFGAIVKMLLLSGQRREEVTAMEWRELDLENRKWTIPGARTKNKREHVVPLSDAMIAIIERHPKVDDSPYVFPGKVGTPVSGFSKFKERLDGKVIAELRKIAEQRRADPARVEMDHWTLHDLRRTVATRLGDLDVLPHAVEALLNHISGHKSGVAGRYNLNQYNREKRIAIDRWGEFVSSLIEETTSKVVPMRAEA